MPTGYQAIIAALIRKEEQQEPGKQHYHEPEDQKRPNAMPKLRCATPKHDSAIVAKQSVRVPKKRGARADKHSNACPIGPTSMVIRMLFARSVSTSRLLTKRRFCMLVSHYGLTRHRKCSAGTLDLIYMRVSIKHFVVLRIQHPRQFASC